MSDRRPGWPLLYVVDGSVPEPVEAAVSDPRPGWPLWGLVVGLAVYAAGMLVALWWRAPNVLQWLEDRIR